MMLPSVPPARMIGIAASPKVDKPDPYNTHPTMRETIERSVEEAMVDWDKQQRPSEARRRMIAALAAEMGRKPIEPRYPHEGRSDRVTGYRRWEP